LVQVLLSTFPDKIPQFGFVLQVSAVPPGGELLGSSARTTVEIFAVGETALGVQGHPEFNLDVLTDLIEDRRAKGVLTVG
jgi:GMP synthase-like glutamine amidotransferase